MNVISHRGLWAEAEESNTIAAFQRSFLAGYGTEIDVRDLDGTLVVSHDPPRLGALPLADVLAEHAVASRLDSMRTIVMRDGTWLTYRLNLGHVADDGVAVPLVSMSTVLRSVEGRRVDMLKVDPEGGEADLFASDAS